MLVYSRVINIDVVNKEFEVEFFSPDGHTGFVKDYKTTKDLSWITNANMLLKVISLKKTTVLGRLFKLAKNIYDIIENKFSSRMADG